MTKRKKIGILLGLFLISVLHSASYTDRIAVKADEAWPAVLQVLQPYGIQKQKPMTEAQTNWIEDEVKRSRGVLKKFFSANYSRRYRIDVALAEDLYETDIRIRGVFQERSADAAMGPWRPTKMQRQDYEVEHEFFNKILHQIEANRTLKKEGKII